MNLLCVHKIDGIHIVIMTVHHRALDIQLMVIGNCQVNGGHIRKNSYQHDQTKGLKDIVCVNAKGDYSMAVDSEGYVWYWGKERIDSADEFIKLSADDATPKRINAINNVKEVDSSGTYALALKKDGTVWKFDNRTPDLVQKVDGLCDIEQIQMGKVYGDSNKYFAMALDKDGNVWGWGNNKDYCLVQQKKVLIYSQKKMTI